MVEPASDSYDIVAFARDDPRRFFELVEHLSPRDAEIILCFALLQKRPTDLSILFGKAGHRAEEDLHKAAHKLAGLIEFGPNPDVEKVEPILARIGADHLHEGAVGYSQARNFEGFPGLRQRMFRAFKKLHASEGREEGLLAGWLLWLVDGSDPQGKGWRKRKSSGTVYKLGPTVFGKSPDLPRYEGDRWTGGGRVNSRGGQGQIAMQTKIGRKLKFLLREK
jgi:hypothetical protein